MQPLAAAQAPPGSLSAVAMGDSPRATYSIRMDEKAEEAPEVEVLRSPDAAQRHERVYASSTRYGPGGVVRC
jgi:hypothetical protein